LTLENICDYINEKKYSQIVISWLGDAFLHKNFYEYIDYIFSRFPRIFIYVMTKWQSLKKSDILKFQNYKQAGYNLNMTFSIFSLEEKKYYETTGGWSLKDLLNMISFSHQSNINYNFEFFLDIGNVNFIPQYKKLCDLFWKGFHYSIPHNWAWKLTKDIYETMFDADILEKIVQKRRKGEKCEVFATDYVIFDYKWDVYKCWLKRMSKDLYIGNINSWEKLDYSKLDYTTCSNCSYFTYKTKIW